MSFPVYEAGRPTAEGSRLGRLPAPLWVLLYTGIYTAVLGVGSGIYSYHYSPDPSLVRAIIEAIVSIMFGLLFSILPFAAMLGVIRHLRGLRPWQFRLAVIPLCCLPSVLTAEPGMLTVTLPSQIIMAFLVAQPARGIRSRTGW